MKRRIIALLAGWMVCALAIPGTAQAKHNDSHWKKDLKQRQRYERARFKAHEQWERRAVRADRGRTVIYQTRYPHTTVYRTRTVHYGPSRATLAIRQRAEREALRRRLAEQRRLAAYRHHRDPR